MTSTVEASVTFHTERCELTCCPNLVGITGDREALVTKASSVKSTVSAGPAKVVLSAECIHIDSILHLDAENTPVRENGEASTWGK